MYSGEIESLEHSFGSKQGLHPSTSAHLSTGTYIGPLSCLEDYNLFALINLLSVKWNWHMIILLTLRLIGGFSVSNKNIDTRREIG
jgi:hypothetical protein